MSCEAHRQQLSLMMDAETGGAEQPGLFAHLEGCGECRQFFDALLRFRRTAQRDRDELLREADEALPARLPLPAARAPRARPWSWPRAVLPAPAALAMAALLLVAGIAIGVGLAARTGRTPRLAPEVETAGRKTGEPTVIYVCSMPEVEVTAAPEARASD